MEILIFILLRIDYIFVAGLSLYIAFNNKSIDDKLFIHVTKLMYIGYAWACAYWAISKLFVNEPFPTVGEFVFSWSLIFVCSKIALYKILKK